MGKDLSPTGEEQRVTTSNGGEQSIDEFFRLLSNSYTPDSTTGCLIAVLIHTHTQFNFLASLWISLIIVLE